MGAGHLTVTFKNAERSLAGATSTAGPARSLWARRQGKPTPFHRVDITSPPQFRNSTRRPQISDVLPGTP